MCMCVCVHTYIYIYTYTYTYTYVLPFELELVVLIDTMVGFKGCLVTAGAMRIYRSMRSLREHATRCTR